MPAGRDRACELPAIVEREGEIARGVAIPAMRQRLGDIGTAIPRE
jgi:hypothetical protein